MEGLNAGGTIRSPFMDGVLEVDVLAVPFDMPEIDDMFEMVDAMDSAESRRARFPDGRLGGKAGDGCADGVRGGSRGGGVGLGGFETAWPVRIMVGGGRTPFRLDPLGSLPIPFCEME